MLSVGIVGLPNSGKSTLFNALLKRQIAQVAEYPYTTIEPNVGVVEVPDRRLTLIAERLSLSKMVPAAIKFIDIAGLIKGASQGEGLGNQFLAHIREVDAILHVVRAFDPSIGSGQAIPHVMGTVDPTRDVEVVNLELELAGIKKPTIYVLNVDEKSMGSIEGLKRDAVIIPICAKLEAELSELSDEDQKAYLKELGTEGSGLDQVIVASYKLLNLITFFTVVGGSMAQAWPVKEGTTMIEAAQVVHSDFAHGFIAAETINWQRLVESEGWHAAHEKGLIHLAGRDEKVVDGEVIEFKFSL